MYEIVPGLYLILGYNYNCNGYMIKSQEQSLLIDSGLGKTKGEWTVSEQDPFKELEKVIIDNNTKQICLTHAHIDHVGGVMSLDEKLRSKIIVSAHELEAPHLELPDHKYIDPVNNTVSQPIIINEKLKNGSKIYIGEYELEVIHTPGHTSGSICLYDAEKRILFSGDTVFPDGAFGRVDFPGSNSAELLVSLEIVSNLSIKTLCPGHMDPLLVDVQESLEQSYYNAKHILS